MTTTLRLVLDQLVAPTDPDLAMASRELTRALIATAPRGCDVAAAVPAVGEDALGAVRAVDGIARVEASPIPRRELATALSLGLPSGLGAGMLHSPTLFAPLVRHDRVHNHDQTVVTIWDLTPWTHPERMPKAAVAWHRAMLKRAQRYADAVVVPLHAMADELGERTKLGDRLRVVAGAAPDGFRVPTDVVGRLRNLDLPPSFVTTSGGVGASPGLLAVFRALAGTEVDVVVIDCPEDDRPRVLEIASAARITEGRVHVRGTLEPFDRAAVLGSSSLHVATSARRGWPWRAVEAVRVGVPVVAVDTLLNREVLGDAALFVSTGGFGEAISEALGAASERLGVLASDRAKAFSWREAAERVWQLHAEL